MNVLCVFCPVLTFLTFSRPNEIGCILIPRQQLLTSIMFSLCSQMLWTCCYAFLSDVDFPDVARVWPASDWNPPLGLWCWYFVFCQETFEIGCILIPRRQLLTSTMFSLSSQMLWTCCTFSVRCWLSWRRTCSTSFRLKSPTRSFLSQETRGRETWLNENNSVASKLFTYLLQNDTVITETHVFVLSLVAFLFLDSNYRRAQCCR